MARTRRGEERLFSTEEYALVAKTKLHELKELADDVLSDLVAGLRQARDKARDIAKRQRREMRGKARPSGGAAATDDTGSRGKSEALTAAARRAGKEQNRRRNRQKRAAQPALSAKALRMKQSARQQPHPTAAPVGATGMRNNPNTGIAPSGAFDAEGDKPVLERSHQAR